MHKNLSILLLIILTSTLAVAADKKNKYPFKPSDFSIIPLNSPVKEAFARFKVELPNGYAPDEIKIKIVNTSELRKDQKKFNSVILSGSEIRILVSKLPPGFYRLYVKLKDKKNNSEKIYSSAFHDFVRFAIDDSLEVAGPDPKINNATLAGVDSDNNGIRDDIQRFINQTYPDENIKLALKQAANTWQNFFTDVTNEDNAKYYTDKHAEDLRCLLSKTPQWAEYSRQIETLSLNSEMRIKKNLEREKLIHGHTTPASIINFQRSRLKNYDFFCDF